MRPHIKKKEDSSCAISNRKLLALMIASVLGSRAVFLAN